MTATSCRAAPVVPRSGLALHRGVRALLFAACGLLLAVFTASAATTSETKPFNFNHGGAVDSGLISVLGTFTTTVNAAPPAMTFSKFDPALGTLTAVDVTVTTTGTNFTVVPTGLLSLVSAASATRTLTFSVVAGNSTGGATNSLATTGGTLLTLLGLGGANIGGAPLASTVPFTTPADLAAFSGNGTVVAGLQSTDVLVVSTLVSLANGAGISASGSYVGTVKVTYTYQASTPVSGRVFTDDGRNAGTANDGLANGGEPGVGGRTLRLLDASNAVLGTTVTAADGRYRLLVSPTVPAGTALRVQVVDNGTSLPTGGSPGSTAGTYTRGTNTVAWTFAGATAHTGVDFGEVPMPTLTGESRQAALPGTVAFHRHWFVSPSAGQVTFSATHTATPAVPGWTETIHVDTNDNGSIDAGEVPATGPVTVVPGQVVPLIVRVAVPEGAPYGARIAGTLQASMAYTGAPPALVSDSRVLELTLVTTDHAGALVLRKSANKATVLPGATIVYAITFTNSGDVAVADIVIRDTTPSHTTFVSAVVTTLPAGLGTPVATAPAAGAAGPLAWNFPGQLVPGASGVVSFTVRVDP